MKKLLACFAVGFLVGQFDPVGWAAWRALGAHLPKVKAESLASESPFDKIPRDQWVTESPNAYAVHDTYAPTAPVHLLVVPKVRVPTVLDASPQLLGEMLELAREAASQSGIADSGFRIIINTNPEGGQTVYHLHMHVKGGHQNREPLLPVLWSRLLRSGAA